MQKVYTIKNDTDQTVTLTQGSGGDVSIPAGKIKVLYCDGAGAGAEVVDLSTDYVVPATTLADLGITASAAELNILDGVTATASELNILDGVTSTTAELNILDGVTATASELNILDGVTATATELNYNDGAAPGTVAASKTVVANASGHVPLGSTWAVYESGGVLYFSVSGTAKAKVDASGNLTVSGSITAGGTI
jgi:hypothetical protein